VQNNLRVTRHEGGAWDRERERGSQYGSSGGGSSLSGGAASGSSTASGTSTSGVLSKGSKSSQ